VDMLCTLLLRWQRYWRCMHVHDICTSPGQGLLGCMSKHMNASCRSHCLVLTLGVLLSSAPRSSAPALQLYSTAACWRTSTDITQALTARWLSDGVVCAVQATEDFAVHLFEDCNLCAIHAKRVTISKCMCWAVPQYMCRRCCIVPSDWFVGTCTSVQQWQWPCSSKVPCSACCSRRGAQGWWDRQHPISAAK
jgi:histone H3/H4